MCKTTLRSLNFAGFYLMIGLALVILGGGCISTNYRTGRANTEATDSIRECMTAMYSGDIAGYNKVILPCAASDLLVAVVTLTPAELTALSEDVSVMDLMQTDPYRFQGRKVKPGRRGVCPVGTKATFMTQFRGVNLVVPVVYASDAWKVDVRYWIAMFQECKESDPEVAVRKFLYFLIGRKVSELVDVTPSGSDLTEFLKGDSPFEDQYYALAIEMPVVEAIEGESMALPRGKILKAHGSSPKHKWFVGMYGPHQLVFELRKEGGSWKTIPQDYLSVIGIGMHPSTTFVERPDRRRMGL